MKSRAVSNKKLHIFGTFITILNQVKEGDVVFVGAGSLVI
jgi:hypothetical protein